MDNSIFKLKPVKGQKQTTADITISGDFTINNIVGLKQSIMEVLDNYDSIDLTVDNPANIDLTAVQLLISIQESASLSNKELNFRISVPEDLSKLLEHAGFTFHLMSNNQ